MRASWALVSFILMTSANSAHADFQRAAPLAGLSSFRIVIENLNENAMECGVSREDLDRGIRFIINQSKIDLTQSSDRADGTIYLNVLLTSDCAAATKLEVETPTTIMRTGRFAYATIWKEAGYATRGRIFGQVQNFARELVNDWNLVNRTMP